MIMCLAVPALVKEIRPDGSALVDLEGVEMEVRLDLVPEAKAGQYLVVHAGYAISVLDEEEARETLKLLEEMDG